MHKITIYRDDSTAKVEYLKVKHYFFTADNTILTLAVMGEDDTHHYIHWPINRVCWFKDEPLLEVTTLDSMLAAAMQSDGINHAVKGRPEIGGAL
jgi:hypothetical protein